MPDEIPAIRHPFTGLRTPDRLYAVTSLKEHTGARGVAYTATLRRDRTIIGKVDNDGRGGMTFFYPGYWPPHRLAVTQKDLDTYAQRCRTEAGQPVTAEELLDALVDEYDWQRRLKRAGGLAILREMRQACDGDSEPFGEPHATGFRRLPTRAGDIDIDSLGPKLSALTEPDSWWQLWLDDHWVDVTTRPTSVPDDRCR